MHFAISELAKRALFCNKRAIPFTISAEVENPIAKRANVWFTQLLTQTHLFPWFVVRGCELQRVEYQRGSLTNHEPRTTK